MTQEQKEKWLVALRSGERRQTTGWLHRKSIDGYCCLGVLADAMELKREEGVSFVHITNENTRFLHPKGEGKMSCDLTSDILPIEVQNVLIGMNDNGVNFIDIANYIDTQVFPDQPSETQA